MFVHTHIIHINTPNTPKRRRRDVDTFRKI